MARIEVIIETQELADVLERLLDLMFEVDNRREIGRVLENFLISGMAFRLPWVTINPPLYTLVEHREMPGVVRIVLRPSPVIQHLCNDLAQSVQERNA